MSKRGPEDDSAHDGGSNKKMRTGDPSQSLTTLRVSNLPPLYDTSMLSTLFSSKYPIKSAFVVSDKETSVSQGYGYVKFDNETSAEEAVKTFDGFQVEAGDEKKKIHVKWATRRLRADDKTATSTATVEQPTWVIRKRATQERTTRLPAPAKEDWDPRQVIVVKLFSTPEVAVEDDDDALKKTLYKKAKKLLTALPNVSEDARLDVEFVPAADNETWKTVHIRAPTPRLAVQMCQKLNSHIVKSRFIVAAVKFELDYLSRRGKSAGARLVLRNLHFAISAIDLYATFATFGAIHSIDIPVDHQKKGRGFAFVWFIHKQCAEKAIEKVNGKLLYAGYGAERIKEGGEGKKQTRQRLKQEGETVTDQGRPVAVDWAVSKEQFEKAETKQDAQDPVEASEEDSDKDEDEDDSEEDEDSDMSPVEESDEEEEEDSDDDLTPVAESDDEEEIDSQPKPKPAEQGTTLFVRNVQFEATEDELYALFKSFGPVRYARIVIDKQTGRSRGTGFVCFYNKADAKKVLDLSAQLESQTTSKPVLNPFSQPSILSVDPSSSTAASLSLHGRVLGVSEAVSRNDADHLREERDKAAGKKDRRNIYLLREGAIEEDSPQAEGLSQVDLEARTASSTTRKALLRTNPSLYVSRTRLSIRQIPLFVTDAMLRKLALHALKAFQAEFKAGTRPGLSAEELRPDPDEEVAQQLDKKERILGAKMAPKGKEKHGRIIPASRVSQSKILRTTERVDSLTGKGRSKGYGFLELTTHADALRCLRWINANPAVGALFKSWQVDDLKKELKKIEGKKDEEDRATLLKEKIEELEKQKKPDVADAKMAKTLIVEFSIENAQTVKRRQERAEKARKRSQEGSSAPRDDAKTDRNRQERGKDRKRKADDTLADKSKKRTKLAVPLSELSEQKFGGVKSLIGKKRKERKAKRAGGK